VPGEQFSTKSPDTFTQTVPSPNFKPLAVRRRTVAVLVVVKPFHLVHLQRVIVCVKSRVI
jgi:hypothetical protein